MESNPTAGSPVIAALSRDVFFGMRIRTILRQLGYDVNLLKDEPALVESVAAATPDLILVDFNAPIDWDALAPVIESPVKVIGFGSHTDVEGFRAAKAAKVDRVVSNGEFSRSLPNLVGKYATTHPAGN